MIPIFQWMAWGNIFKYAGEILVANEFHDLQLTCRRNGKKSLADKSVKLHRLRTKEHDNFQSPIYSASFQSFFFFFFFVFFYFLQTSFIGFKKDRDAFLFQ